MSAIQQAHVDAICARLLGDRWTHATPMQRFDYREATLPILSAAEAEGWLVPEVTA